MDGDEEFDLGEGDEDLMASTSMRSSTIFSKDGFDCNLEDFVIKKVIGKGAFGRVFLVENKKHPGEIYAMKAIRKDKIIDFE